MTIQGRDKYCRISRSRCVTDWQRFFECENLRRPLHKIKVDVLRQSSNRVSSSAEVYGAVQQEARISRVIEIMLLHVENVKRAYERDRAELEEAKRSEANKAKQQFLLLLWALQALGGTQSCA